MSKKLYNHSLLKPLDYVEKAMLGKGNSSQKPKNVIAYKQKQTAKRRAKKRNK